MMSFFASTAVSYGLSARARWFALLLMTIFCGLSGASASAMAESATQTVSATNTSQVRQLTTELAQLIAHYRQADDSEQANLLNEIQSITEQRQALLLEFHLDGCLHLEPNFYIFHVSHSCEAHVAFEPALHYWL